MKNVIRLRAVLRGVSCSAATDRVMTTTVELEGDHGRVAITLGPDALAWLIRGGDRLERTQFEVTLRRVRRAPKVKR